MKKNYALCITMLLITLSNFVYAQNSRAIINNYLYSNAKSVSSQTIEWEITDEIKNTKTNSVSVYAQQQFNGIDIHKAKSTFTLKNNKVLYAADGFLNLSNLKKSSTSPALSPLQAVQSAASSLKVGNVKNLEITEGVSSKEFILNNGGISVDPIPVKLIYIANEKGNLQLAWNLSIHTLSGEHWWSVKVDASSGEIISLNDWVLNCTFEGHNHNKVVPENSVNLFKKSAFSASKSVANAVFSGESYRVFPLPYINPDEANRELLFEPQNSTSSPFGWHDTNGAEGAEYTITRGNNVWAYEDTDGSGGAEGTSPNGTADLTFDFPLELNNTPSNYLKAATTNLFYVNNMIHDIVYFYGFDEASGNFQSNNYNNGGIGNDFVKAVSQDGSSLNNASFATPPEGRNPQMRMYLWSPVGPPGDVLVINSPAGLAKSYAGLPAAIGNPLPVTPITKNLILVVDNNSSFGSTDPNDGCDTFLNSGDISNNIAVIRRGGCEFQLKIKKAQQAGAKAVIIVNDRAGLQTIDGDDSSIYIPSVMISQADGEELIAALKNGTTINASLSDNGPYQLDGDFDNGIIIHEYTHGISTRLTGGPSTSDCLTSCTEVDEDGNCVAGTFTEQMGEGWSDFFALILTMKTSDSRNKGRGIGTYIYGQDIDGIGIRPAPYSPNRSINDYTYGNTNDKNLSAPHGVGFVWATMLWDITWDLVDIYGFDPDIYTGSGGNNIALKLVTQGMKMQICQPGFIDGRDAILAADDVLYEGKHKCLIYQAFAKRGLGLSAKQGEVTNRFDQLEAFDVPPEYEGDCLLGVDDQNIQDKAFRIYPNPTAGNINIAITGSLGDGSISIYDINGRKVYSATKELNGILTLNPGQLAKGIYLIKVENKNSSVTRKLMIK
tara:strand:- start:17789 stop:20461 length:2673 start_codon:yes stop_codon:yes gene_type:complete